MAAIINTLHEHGQTDFTVWDVLTRLRELDLVEDLWDWKGDDGAKKSVGDCVGGHGLKIPSAMKKREINGESKLVRVYQIPDGGITDTYCEENLITLVDDPKEPDPEPVEVIDDITMTDLDVDDVQEADADTEEVVHYAG